MAYLDKWRGVVHRLSGPQFKIQEEEEGEVKEEEEDMEEEEEERPGKGKKKEGRKWRKLDGEMMG